MQLSGLTAWVFENRENKCAAAQALTVVNRLCCTFACKTYQIGPKKRVGVMLTRTGCVSDAACGGASGRY